MKNKESLERLKRIADIIFVLAMMLMILQFNLPDIKGTMSNDELKEFLFSQIPALSIYLETFILIVFYWVNNVQQFRYYQHTDSIHLWLNLLSLMFVVIIPYTNNLSSLYPFNVPVQIFYSINLFFVGLFSYLSWLYASNKYRLIDENLTKEEISSIGLESIIEPIICLATIPVSLINPKYWNMTFLLIIPIYIGINLLPKFRKSIYRKEIS